MDIQTKIQKLLEANLNNATPEGGLFLDKALQQAKLDYTPDSLKRIDVLLNQIREKIKPVEEGFINDVTKENFALTLASYIGSYLCKEANGNALWFTYQEAVKQLPPDPKLPQNFTTHLVANIENTVVMPMAALLRIFNGEAHTAEHYFNDVLKLIKDIQAVSKGWKQNYLNDFLAGRTIPCGIAFEQELRKQKLDFSLESLDAIDELLIAIKQQTQPDYARWMEAPSLRNFLYLLGTYLGATTALNANCFVKWLDYEQAKAIDPNMPHLFVTSFNAEFGSVLTQPVGKVCDLLFADDNKINCRGFAEREVMRKGTHRMIHLYPNMQSAQQKNGGFFSKFNSNPAFNPKWVEPFREAGFMAAFAASGLAGNSQLSPQLLQGARSDRKKLIIDFSFYENWDKANKAASDYMEGNAEKVPFQVHIFDGYANLPLERLDAMYIDIRHYDSPKMSCLLIVPYRQASSPEGFKIYSPKLCNSTIPEELASNVANAFFAGAINFVGLNWDKASWNKYFDGI